MALSIESVYKDVALDNINSAENGELSYQMFSRLSKRAEIRLMDYITGDVENIKPPTPYSSQKLRDMLSPFIVPLPAQVTNGKITKPEDYYGYENMFLLGDYNNTSECDSDDDEGIVTSDCNITIELLTNSQFYNRCNTFIEGLKPSFIKPVAKEVGNEFSFLPKDLGSITLEYIKYPVFGVIVGKEDTVTHDEIVDDALTVNYEWNENARELLVFFITQEYSINTREQALMQANAVEGKLIRG